MRYTISPILTTLLLASTALADTPNVVTDFGPIDSLTRQVMGDLGQPVMLLPKGGDPHDFQLKPSQAQALSDADLIFWDGPELMPALNDAITTLATNAKSVPLLHAGGGKIRLYEGDEGTDPHAWLDPTNAEAWLATIAAELAAKDPANAATYTANAANAQTALRAMDADLTTQLSLIKAKPFVVFHDALGYFADHYGLTTLGAIELGDATEPGAAQLTAIKTILTDSKAVCVFPELGRDPKFIETVTEGTTARIGAGQDVEATHLDPGPGQYEALLRGIATTLTDCLSKG
jgi:zinc transport system substrate-binding protein